MVDRIWRGDAPTEAQVTRICFGDIRSGDEISLTINNKTITLTAESNSPSDLIDRFVDAIAADDSPEWNEVTAGTAGDDPYNPDCLELTSTLAGRPFIVSVSSGSTRNEKQTIVLGNNPTGGTFTLTFRGETTAGIAFDASAADVESALEGLSGVNVGDVSVTGGPLPDNTITVEFTGQFLDTDVSLMSADAGGLTGGDAEVKVTTIQQGAPAQNEIQRIELFGSPTGGTFTLTFEGQTTAGIAFNASAADVASALEALPNIQSGDIIETGGALPGIAVDIEFGGSLAQTDVGEMEIDPSNLTGGSISASISTTQQGARGRNEVQFFSITPIDILDGTTESVNEIHKIAGDAAVTAGTWDLTLWPGGGTIPQKVISNIDFDVSPERLLSLIEGHADISPGQVAVRSAPQNQRLDDGADYFIEWIGHNLGGHDAVEPTIDSTNLTGGTYTPSTDTAGFEAAEKNMGGQYRFTLANQETQLFGITAGGVSVETAIADLYGADPADVSVDVHPGSSGSSTRAIGIKVTFQNALGGQNVAQLGVDGSFLNNGAKISAAGRIEGGIGATNEIQQISISGTPTQGTFDVAFQGQTATLNYDDTAAEVEDALEALSTIGTGNVDVTGGPLPGTAVDVEFIDDLGSLNVPQMNLDDTNLVSALTTTQHGAPSAQNEIQRLSIDGPRADVHDGSFTLTLDANTTAAIDWDATAAEVESALEALANVSDVAVTGGPFPANDIDVEFRGTEAATDVSEMTTASSIDSGTVTVDTAQPGSVPASVLEHVRSRGPNHWDDPLNWTGLRVPESGDTPWVDGGPSILYGLKQRSDFTADAGTDLLTMTDIADFREGQKVSPVSTGTLPAGLSAGTDYFILDFDRDTRTCKLSATAGGAAIDLTDAGTGTHTLEVHLDAIHVTDAFLEQGGLPVINEDGDYYEYRDRALQIDLDPNGLKEVIVGGPEGSGPGLFRFDFGSSAVDDLRIRSTGGAIESGRPAVTAIGSVLNLITVIAGHFGVAVFPSETSVVTELIVRGGEVEVGKGTTLTTLDKTGGLLQVDEATLNGTAVIE